MAARHRRGDRRFLRQPGDTPKVYIETSVWGMILVDQPRALREPTMQFLAQCRSGVFVPHVSKVVVDEIELAPPWAQRQMMRAIDKLAPPVLEPTKASEELADAYLKQGVIPTSKRDDARHVAIATVAGLEIVVSWNHRHMVNERKRTLFNAVNQLAGYERTLLILTPFEVVQ